jgi:DNA-directed RNA polymerase subunit RPC12/RpoP
MSISLGGIFGAIRKSGIYGSLLASMNQEEKRYEKSSHYIELIYIYLYIWKDEIENKFDIAVHAKCSDSYLRTGISDGDMPRIYKCHGFETFDGAFGFMTEQVEQAIKKFSSTRFLFYPVKETHLYNIATIHEYDNSTKSWIPYSICIYKCSKCNSEISIDESLDSLQSDDDILCEKCGGEMYFDRFKFKDHYQELN